MVFLVGDVTSPEVSCAKELKECLKTFDFDLNDRFYDRQDLQNTRINMKIPKPLLRFFGALHDFNYLSYDVTAREVLT